MAGPLARLAAGTCTVFGSAWLIAFAFDRYLTSLLVESTVQTLNDPVVEAEVYRLLRTLLTDLLNDPEIRRKAPGFLKRVMSQETFEEAAKVLLSDAAETTSYHKRAFDLMQLVSSGVLDNCDIQERMNNTVHEVVGLVHQATTWPHHVPLQPFSLRSIPEAPSVTALSNADFAGVMLAFKQKVGQFELQTAVRTARLESELFISTRSALQPQALNILQLDPGAQFAQICESNAPAFQALEQRMMERKVELERQAVAILAAEQLENARMRAIEEVETAKLVEQIGAMELQPPQKLEWKGPEKRLARLMVEQNEAQYLTY